MDLRVSPARRAAGGVFAVTLLGFLAAGATLPVLPRYVRGPIGAGDLAVGIVTGAFAVAAVLSRPLAGRLADSHGPRRVMGLGAGVMALAGMLLFVPAGLPGLLASRLAFGAGEGFLFTAASTWIVDLAPEQRRGQIIGLFGLSVWGGLTLGTVVGQALADVGYDAVWLLALAAPALALLLSCRLANPHHRTDPVGGAPGALRAVALPGAALALGNVGYATFISFIVLDIGRHGGAVITTFAATVVFTRLVLGRLPDRLGPRRTAVGAALAESAGLAVIALAHTWWVAALGAVLMAAGFSLLYPALALIVVDAAAARRRGAAMGLFTAFFDAGMGLGAPLAGAVAALSGYAAAFWAAAALAALGALLGRRAGAGSA
ncbi:MAG: MFS transporter [Solirubrobacteraceae bacterium]